MRCLSLVGGTKVCYTPLVTKLGQVHEAVLSFVLNKRFLLNSHIVLILDVIFAMQCAGVAKRRF